MPEAPKEYGSRALKAGRMYQSCRGREVEDAWNVVVMAIRAFEGVHTK